MTQPDDDLRASEKRQAPLRSRAAGGTTIAGMLGTLDRALTNRPGPVAQIEERYREPWATADGITVDGLDEPVDRPEPPDRSRAEV